MDPNISANTLFHFTSSQDSLKSILKNGLFVRYSLEDYTGLLNGKAEIALPMVCFCDIPLSQIKKHTDVYGTFAIGLAKSWGINHKINPVIYTYPNSAVADSLTNLEDDISSFFNISEKVEEKPEQKPEKNIDTTEIPQEILTLFEEAEKNRGLRKGRSL